MPVDQSVTWASIKDFSPGIHQRLSPDYPPGTASPDNTYRCFAVEGGALSPLPARLHSTITKSPPIDPSTNQAEEFRIIGLHCANPVYWPPEATPGIAQDNSEIFLATEYWVGGTLTQAVSRYRRHYQYNPAWQEVWSASDTSTYSSFVRPRHTVFGTQRSNHDDPTQSGPTVVCWVSSGRARFFPDDTATTTLGTHYMPGDYSDPANSSHLVAPDSLVLHQGRVVIMPLTTAAFGPGSLYTQNEVMYWTEANDLRTLAAEMSGNFFNVTVGNEAPTGYGVMASLTANELFLIKCRGGAYIITGDLSGIGTSAFITRTLPYVRSTGLSMNNGAYGPVGYVYPTDGGGVWLWQGGDYSTHITKHLEPEFWRPPATDLSGNATAWGYQWSQCDSANNWVLFPNNWLWDTDLNGWWRVDNPDDYIIHRWAVDWRSHFAYGAPRGFRNNTDPALYEYDLTSYASSYSWQSQPLAATIDSSVNVQDVAIVATGLGRIDVTVSSRDTPDGHTESFWSTSSSYPDVQRQSFGVQGTHVVIRVEAYAEDPDGAAPLIHEIRYSTSEGNPIRR